MSHRIRGIQAWQGPNGTVGAFIPYKGKTRIYDLSVKQQERLAHLAWELYWRSLFTMSPFHGYVGWHMERVNGH